MGHLTERGRKDWEKLTPEQRAAVEHIRAANRTPEGIAARVRAADLEDKDNPKAAPQDDLLALLSALRAERERQGLSLTDVSARSGIERAMLNKLELGKVANPTVATLRAFAVALGGGLTLGLRTEPLAPDARQARNRGGGVLS
jgi:ribosome-binding protein aMBF1 (putative translation factor)